MTLTIFKNCAIFDGVSETVTDTRHVLVKDGLIAEISETPIRASGAAEVDVSGRTLMPGLIDAHVHIFSLSFSAAVSEAMPLTLMTALAIPRISSMLDRGFTSVRDVAGGDVGTRTAVARGALVGPRLFVGGPALSQTGGHGDHRRATASQRNPEPNASAADVFSRLVDSPDEMRLAVRDELRKDSDHIKVMASGGVGSPTDRIENIQFSPEELAVAVAETRARGKYVCAHAYMSSAIRHCLEAGIRTIEHANFIDAETAAFAKEKDAYIVPTLVCYDETYRHGRELKLSDAVMEKLKLVNDAGIGMLEICERSGVKMGFGTDLVAEMGVAQSTEFVIRGRVQKPVDVLRSATSVNAEIVQMAGKLGVVAPGAIADLIVVDGNPLERIDLLAGQGENIPVVMKAGAFHRNTLGAAQSAGATVSLAS